MKGSKIFALVFILWTLPTFIHAQKSKIDHPKSKSQLEKEKEENLQKIRETNKILEETKNKKKATLGQLSAIKQQISARTNFINSINSEITRLESEIHEAEDVIISLESDMSILKKEYAAMTYAASKSNKYYDKLTFIFSAGSFNQLVSRLKYFKQYSQARKHQVEQIQKVTSMLNEQKAALNAKKRQKYLLLHNKTQETENLRVLQTEQDGVVKELSKKEKELKKELEETKKSQKKLDKLITDLIAAERAKAAREAREAAARGNAKVNAENAELSSSFSGNHKKLPWPVVHGSVSQKFGKQAHPVLKGVYIDNLGVDIQTLKGEQVRSVFQGKVITVASVPGMNQVVMIQHGDYFTVYAKLKTVYVKTGQEVKAKDIIGEVYSDKNEVSELQFQVWNNSQKMDPEAWLYPR